MVGEPPASPGGSGGSVEQEVRPSPDDDEFARLRIAGIEVADGEEVEAARDGEAVFGQDVPSVLPAGSHAVVAAEGIVPTDVATRRVARIVIHLGDDLAGDGVDADFGTGGKVGEVDLARRVAAAVPRRLHAVRVGVDDGR